MIVCQLNHHQHKIFFPLNINSSKPSATLLTMLFIIFVCLSYNANGSTTTTALSRKGPFYTETFSYTNQYTSNFIGFTVPFHGWQFSYNIFPMPSNYSSISIQSIQISSDSDYLTFYIENPCAYQTYISFAIKFCQGNLYCFTSVNLRILAIDYDMPIFGATYNQVVNGALMFNATFMQGQSMKTIYISNPLIDLTQFSYALFLNGFRLSMMYGYNYVSNGMSQYSQNIDFYVYYYDSNSSSNFQILFYCNSILESNNRFKVYFQSYDYIAYYNQINFSGDSTSYPSYPSQTLIFGIGYLDIQDLRISLQTTILSDRSFRATSYVYNTNIHTYIGVYWLTISKVLCPPSNSIYITNSGICNATCQSQGYYLQNGLTCNTCQNLRCLACNDNSTACIACDPTTRTLQSNNSDCIPNTGYYQNGSPVAASCVGNCTECQNNISCDICISDHYYSQNQYKCLHCSQIISHCNVCSNSTSVTCLICQNNYYNSSSGLCHHCVDNCTICSNSNSCTTCVNDYIYSNSNHKCLACQNIFTNCLVCVISNATNSVQCQTCNDTYYKNSTHGCSACVDNCTVCTDSSSCTTCANDFVYTNNLNKCLACQEIFTNCLMCLSANSTNSVQCQTCNDTYYKNSVNGCSACVDNCTVCTDSFSCTTCVNDYVYSNIYQKCLDCEDIFANCLLCQISNSTNSTQCQTCEIAYYKNTTYGCTACVANCTSCTDSWSCDVCLTLDYIYYNNTHSCMLCYDIFSNCAKCTTSNASGLVQCCVCENQFALNISTNASFDTTCFFTYCGDFIILPQQEECDDGNNIDLDGCNSQCKIQQGFNCTQEVNENYTDYNLSKCFYAESIQIIRKYLEKDPSQNKVTFRFNLQPKLFIFTTIDFLSQFSDTIQVLWNGYSQGTLKVFKIQNGLQKNGLYAITFSYQKQWKNVQISFNPANTNLSMFTTTASSARLLFQNESRILQAASGQTPSSSTILPQKSNNNLIMFSDKYSLYTLSKFCSFFLVFSVWIYWLVGLFYGKIVVIDFIIVIQLILLCSMTSGELSPSISGMMLQNFAFYDFTGLFSPDYQARSIYQNISSQLVAGNMSNISIQNLSMWLFITIIMLLIGLTSKFLLKICNSNNLILNIISKYIFGEYLLYSLLPFLLNGSISTVLFVEKLIQEAFNIQIIDMLIIAFFNITFVMMIVLGIIKSQFFGQFRTHFLRFDISQYFYVFVLIYVAIIGYVFTLLFGTNLIKFAPGLVIFVFISIISFNICKKPYLQSRHPLRIYILYGTGILLSCMILIQNITMIDSFKQYLSVIVIGLQLILSFITGYYLFLSIKIDGKPKFDSFLEEYNQKNVQIQTDQLKELKETSYQVPISYRLNSSAIDYYQKQSKILQNLKKNTLPETTNYDEEYKKLKNQLNLKQKNGSQLQISPICNEQSKIFTENLIKSSKFMKMSLKCHLINEDSQITLRINQFQIIKKKKRNLMIKFSIKCQLNKENKQINLINQNKTQLSFKIYKIFQTNQQRNIKLMIFLSKGKNRQRLKSQKFKSSEKLLNKKEKLNMNFLNVIKPPMSPIEQLKQISYYQWAKQIQAEDQQLQKAKIAQSKLFDVNKIKQTKNFINND